MARVRIVGGTVTGDVVNVSEPTSLNRRARVDGDLNYGDEKPVVAQGAVVGGKIKKFDAGDAFPFSGFAFTLLVWLAVSISSLLLGLVLLAFAPRAADAALVVSREATWPAIGWGALLVFGLPILAVIALVTLVGIPLGVGLLLALVPLYSVGYVTGAWLLGRRIIKPPTSRFLAFLVGWAILRVLALDPGARWPRLAGRDGVRTRGPDRRRLARAPPLPSGAARRAARRTHRRRRLSAAPAAQAHRQWRRRVANRAGGLPGKGRRWVPRGVKRIPPG